ncbi:MAG: thiopeptide-type bacteriocin biosynthesis protein [Bacteroidales bacterium]|nr:thiopeptide-type bacteriocin biosynthesis protein [Bacteroidales bacterium]
MVNIKQSFIIGDRWLYYKIYTGHKTAEMILTEILKPAIDLLFSANKINKWFFIRYYDPDFHIRFRLHFDNPEDISSIIEIINKHIVPYLEENLIYKIQLDTYKRELNRYGSNTMEISESLFYFDSEMVISLLSNIYGDEGEKIRWLFSMKAIDQLLNDFKFNLDQKCELLKIISEAYAEEFKMNTILREQISNKYRDQKKSINHIMKVPLDFDSELAPLFQALQNKSILTQESVQNILQLNAEQKLEITLPELVSSFIHMMLNRIFKSKQRVHELVIYEFSYRYYKSEIAKLKYSPQLAMP